MGKRRRFDHALAAEIGRHRREEALRQAQRILTAVEQLAIEHQANPPLTR